MQKIIGNMLFVVILSLKGLGFDVVELTYDGAVLAEVNHEGLRSIIGEELIEANEMNKIIEMLASKINHEPMNAMIDDHGVIVPEKLGVRLNEKEIKRQLYHYFYTKTPQSFEVPILYTYPRVDSELLAHIRTNQIGHYTTYANPRNRARLHNISLALEAINNHVVFPNETFSFNAVVGKRTGEKGYLPAPVIIKGKYYRDFGGGICQVSSTLFNAVDFANLEIVQRYSHSKRVRYVPLGRDAQVSWYGSDFQFKNIYNQPILIQAKLYGHAVSITLYSSDVINID